MRVLSGFFKDEYSELVCNALSSGAVVIAPTDTSYMLGADATSQAAVRRVFEIKYRDLSKPVSIAVESVTTARKFVNWTQAAQRLAEAFLPGALTLMLRCKVDLPLGVISSAGLVGIRIPGNPLTLQILRAWGGALTATSANLSGEDEPYDIAQVLAQLQVKLRDDDIIFDAGELPKNKPSTIVDLSGSDAKLIREGNIPFTKIMEVLDSNRKK